MDKIYPKDVSDLFANSQVLLLGRYHGSGCAVVHVTGNVNGVAKSYSFPVTFAADDSEHLFEALVGNAQDWIFK